MNGREDKVCEVCGDDLCPGCIPEVRVHRGVWLGLGAFVLVALSVRGLELLPERGNRGISVPASTLPTLVDESATTTLLLPSEAETTSTTSATTTTSVVPAPAKVLGPLDHPLLVAKPAAMAPTTPH